MNRLGNAREGQVALDRVEALGQRGVVLQRLGRALVGELDRVRKSGIRERPGGGVRHRARHVRHAVELRVVDGEGRIVVGGRVGVLEAATLVDGDIHQHRSGLHLGDHVVGDELRGLGAGDEHRADHQIGLEDVLLHGEGGAHDTVYLVVEPPEGVAQLVEVGVEEP